MMWRAAARVGSPGTPALAAALGLAGAVAFGASDTLIAFNRFAAPIPGVRWPIMVLYWLGQSGIAASAVLGCGMLREQVNDTMTTTASSPVHVAPVEAIRSRFPALERRHNGLPVAYFDGPGGTQVPQAVVDAMADYLLHHNANTHWAYPTSVETDAALAAARDALADFLGGPAVARSPSAPT